MVGERNVSGSGRPDEAKTSPLISRARPAISIFLDGDFHDVEVSDLAGLFRTRQNAISRKIHAATERAEQMVENRDMRRALSRLRKEMREWHRRNMPRVRVRVSPLKEKRAKRASKVQITKRTKLYQPIRHLPRYDGPIIDREGRRGIFVSFEYDSAKSNRHGIARRRIAYQFRLDHAEQENGEALYLSNMGGDQAEVLACADLLETAARASRKNAKIGVNGVLQCPPELDLEGRKLVLAKMAKLFEDRGIPFVVTMHRPDEGGDQRNFHIHFWYALRPVERLGPFEFAVAQQLRTDLDGPGAMRELRHDFADILTQICRKTGHDVRFTHHSNAARGLVHQPLQKIGPKGTAQARRGEVVAAVVANEAIISQNIATAAAIARKAAARKWARSRPIVIPATLPSFTITPPLRRQSSLLSIVRSAAVGRLGTAVPLLNSGYVSTATLPSVKSSNWSAAPSPTILGPKNVTPVPILGQHAQMAPNTAVAKALALPRLEFRQMPRSSRPLGSRYSGAVLPTPQIAPSLVTPSVTNADINVRVDLTTLASIIQTPESSSAKPIIARAMTRPNALIRSMIPKMANSRVMPPAPRANSFCVISVGFISPAAPITIIPAATEVINYAIWNQARAPQHQGEVSRLAGSLLTVSAPAESLTTPKPINLLTPISPLIVHPFGKNIIASIPPRVEPFRLAPVPSRAPAEGMPQIIVPTRRFNRPATMVAMPAKLSRPVILNNHNAESWLAPTNMHIGQVTAKSHIGPILSLLSASVAPAVTVSAAPQYPAILALRIARVQFQNSFAPFVQESRAHGPQRISSLPPSRLSVPALCPPKSKNVGGPSGIAPTQNIVRRMQYVAASVRFPSSTRVKSPTALPPLGLTHIMYGPALNPVKPMRPTMVPVAAPQAAGRQIAMSTPTTNLRSQTDFSALAAELDRRAARWLQWGRELCENEPQSDETLELLKQKERARFGFDDEHTRAALRDIQTLMRYYAVQSDIQMKKEAKTSAFVSDFLSKNPEFGSQFKASSENGPRQTINGPSSPALEVPAPELPEREQPAPLQTAPQLPTRPLGQ